MERSIIDYVYETDETINDEVYKNKDYREASERALKIYGKLKQTLTDGQKEELEKFIENEAEQEDIKNRITFRCGIKYGVRITAESNQIIPNPNTLKAIFYSSCGGSTA